MFDIKNPEGCICTFYSYQKGHSFLSISVYDAISDTTNRLVFEGVEYIESPIKWEGAKFRLGSENEMRNLLPMLTTFRDIPEEYVLSKMKLYVCIPQNNIHGVKVQIIAQDADLVDIS